MQTEEKCLSCPARLQENECSCLFKNWNFPLETEEYICNFSIHHNVACCELNDSFMELNLLYAHANNRPIYYKRREKLKHDLFKNNLSVLNYEGHKGYDYLLNIFKFKEYPQNNTIKFEGAVGRYQNFTATICNISRTRTITGNTPIKNPRGRAAGY
jgi:hypothetical protein